MIACSADGTGRKTKGIRPQNEGGLSSGKGQPTKKRQYKKACISGLTKICGPRINPSDERKLRGQRKKVSL